MTDIKNIELIKAAIRYVDNKEMSTEVFYFIVRDILFPAKITKQDLKWAKNVIKKYEKKNR